LGFCISSCYGPFSLGARFEIHDPFMYRIFRPIARALSTQKDLKS
jgi:hypothetical protein